MKVPLIGPDGRKYEIDQTEVNAAIEQGYRVEAAETPQTLGEQATKVGHEALQTAGAAVEGAVEGLTGGGLGAAVGAGGGFEEKEVLRRREEHPIASGLGELAGAVMSPLNAPGAAVTKGIGAVTKLGRVGANVVGGATTGVLFGAGKTLSDAALGDVQLTAEKLVAGAGLGALLGAGGGGIGGAVEEGARALLPSVRTLASRAKTALDDVANDAAISSTRAEQRVINRLGDEKVRNVAAVLRDRGHLKGSPEEMLKSVSAERQKLGKMLGDALDAVEGAGKTPTFSQLAKRLDDFEAGLDPISRKTIASDLKDATSAVLELGARPIGSRGPQGAGFKALDVVKQKIQQRGKFSQGAAGADDLSLQLKRDLAHVFRDELDQQLLPQLGADAAKQFTDAKAAYGALRDAEKLALSGSGRPGGIGLRDMIAAVAGSSVHPLGIAAALGSKLMREQGPAIIARVADRLAKEPALQAVAKSFAASLPTVAPKLGQYGAVLAQEAQRSPEHVLAAHIAHAQLDPSYAATAQAAGLTPELPDEHAASMDRAQVLAEAQAAAASHDQRLTEAFDKVISGKGSKAGPSPFTSQDFGSKRMRQEGLEGHKRRVEEVRLLATDPQALIDRVSGNLQTLGDVAPAVTMAMQSTAQRAVQYLAQQAEVPPKPGPLAREWTPTEAERHSFALKLEVVQDPMAVLTRAARGTLVKSQLEAVRVVYPSFAAELEQRALERLASGESMPYRSRLMLSMLSGVSADGTNTPKAIAANQAAIQRGVGKPSERMPAGAGEMELGVAERAASPGQKREIQKGVTDG